MQKKWKTFMLIASIVAIFAIAGCSGGDNSEKTDASPGKKAANEESETRIIAGTVVIAEILDQLELDAIAVPQTEKELPARFDGLQAIGNAMEPDMEIVKSLNATEVLSVSTLEYDLQDKFEQLKIPVNFLNFQSVDAMLEEIKMLGDRYDRNAQAEELVASLQKISTLYKQSQPIKKAHAY